MNLIINRKNVNVGTNYENITQAIMAIIKHSNFGVGARGQVRDDEMGTVLATVDYISPGQSGIHIYQD